MADNSESNHEASSTATANDDQEEKLEKKIFSFFSKSANKDQPTTTPVPLPPAEQNDAAANRGGNSRGGTPTITNISPSSGPLNQETEITITGTNLRSNRMSFAAIAHGRYYACGLDMQGKAYCWGNNEYGKLGDGFIAADGKSQSPVAVNTSGVLNGKTLTKISTKAYHACTLDTDGKAYCWGRNDRGQFGNGTIGENTSSNVPVAVDTSGVLSGKFLVDINASNGITCALDVDGKAYCWGLNNKRQLGNGNNTNSNVPVAVNLGGILAGKTIKEICAFDQSTCVLDVDGQVYCWGGGANGELGHGSTADSATPVVVKAPATNVYLDNKPCTQISVNSDGTALTCRVPASNSYGTVAVSLNHSACSLSLPNVYTYRLKCDVANCTTCSSDDVCQNCDSGYYLDNNQCHACTLPNCNTCSNATTCTT